MKKSAPPPLKKSFLWRFFKGLLILTIWGCVSLFFLLVYFAYDLPDIQHLKSGVRSPSITFLATNGEILATYGEASSTPLVLEQLPSYVPRAVIAIEDRRFYHHWGIDFIGLGRAIWHNYKAGKIVQGGSTLTQQLAKNLFLSSSRSLRRKVQELLLAFWLEKSFTKDQILTIYLNRVYLGAGTYGIEAAAQKYFGKSARFLNLHEAALIAGLLKAPSRLSPFRSPQASEARARLVLFEMVEAGFITQTQRNQALNAKLVYHFKKEASLNTRYFTDWLIEMLPSLISDLNQDLWITTTLSPSLQKKAEDALGNVLKGADEKYAVSQGALVTLAPDGAIKALVGGKDYSQSQYNRASQADRQSGSLFKLFVYLAAIEKGYRAADKISDDPIVIKKWAPKNYGWQAKGTVTLEEGFAYSINTVAVRLAQKVGIEPIKRIAERLGIVGHIPKDLTIALGSTGVTLLEISAAFTSCYNGGYGVWPYGILEIRNHQGQILYQRSRNPLTRVLSVEQVSEIQKMLKAVMIYGTGKKANFAYKSLGKTGTSQNFKDAWFVGMAEGFVTGVWVGNDENQPMKKVTGSLLPLEIWRQFVKA